VIALLVFPLAHAGHWINGALYLSPVLIIGGLLFVQSRRDRKRGDDPYDDPDYEGPDEDTAAP
jgi:hypothetical protein